MRTSASAVAALLGAVLLGGCGRAAESGPAERSPPSGERVAVTDTLIPDALDAAGTALPVRSATLGTKLMGTVTEVLVHEGDRVAAGQLLVRLDARELDARRIQVEAGLDDATAVRAEAALHFGRIRALYADSAATRAQLDQAETALARAEAAVATARGMAAELAATASYAEVRTPFAGTVTRRLVDPGALAAPGTPLVTVEDDGTLRVSVSAAPEAVRGLRRGTVLAATIGDTVVRATVEGVVAAGSNLHVVNALVANPGGRLQSGSAATLALPRGTRRVILVPAGAVLRQGELTGVRTVARGQASLRWVKLGRAVGGAVEVLSGLAAGDTVLVNRGAP